MLSSRNRIHRVGPFNTSVSLSNPSGGVLADVFVSLIKESGLSALHTAESTRRASPSGRLPDAPFRPKTGLFAHFLIKTAGLEGSEGQNKGSWRKLYAAEWKTDTAEWKLHTATWKLNASDWKTNTVDWKLAIIEWKFYTVEWKTNTAAWKLTTAEWKTNAVEWKIITAEWKVYAAKWGPVGMILEPELF